MLTGSILSLLFAPKPPTPNLEDIKEVLRKEAGIDLMLDDDTPPEHRRKQAVSLGLKKVKKKK